MFRDNVFRFLALPLVFFIGSVLPAHATTTYMYSGNGFNSVSCLQTFGPCSPRGGITGSITVAQALPSNLPLTNISVIGFSFTGPAVLPGGPCSPTLASLWCFSSIALATGANGNIVNWNISLDTGTFTGSSYFLSTAPSLDQDGFSPYITYSLANDPGTWIVGPEPGTLLLVGTGLLGIVTKRRFSRE